MDSWMDQMQQPSTSCSAICSRAEQENREKGEAPGQAQFREISALGKPLALVCIQLPEKMEGEGKSGRRGPGACRNAETSEVGGWPMVNDGDDHDGARKRQ